MAIFAASAVLASGHIDRAAQCDRSVSGRAHFDLTHKATSQVTKWPQSERVSAAPAIDKAGVG
jgi:hypothetical protein